MDDPLAPHAATPDELRERLGAERSAQPFLVFRDAQEGQHIHRLTGRTVIGRDPRCDVCLPGDGQVSRQHAELDAVGTAWVIADDGLSRNGTAVNGERLSGRRRLQDGDRIQIGATLLVYREPRTSEVPSTSLGANPADGITVSPAQRRVLVALCRPFLLSDEPSTPLSNTQLAEELCLSVDAIKSHTRALYDAFDLAAVPTREKRTALVARAIRLGIVTERDCG